MKAKKLKIIGIAVMTVIIVCLVARAIYFDTHYAVINNKTYKNDVTFIDPYLSMTNIREINKCTEVEEMHLSGVTENSFSGFINFPKLKQLMILSSDISGTDCEKISQFDKLEELIFCETDVDFTGFKSDTVSSIDFISGTFKNFEVLAECKTLKSISVMNTGIWHTNIMEDMSVFADFDYIEELWLSVYKIEDVSVFLEMDSLKTLEVKKEAISEDNVKLLEDKGVTVTYY
ncbi:MAG: hypothetical protein K2H28_09755 [Ruminococcus sp.]|nr:hypothetical protein [Ruminococcus sp.]